MGTFSSIRSIPFSEFLIFGRSETKIFAIVASETVFLGATFFVATPPFLPIPFSDSAALLITGLLTVVLAAALYVLLSGLGYQTYSAKFHSPAHILKCWAAHLALSTVVIYIGYLLLVYPYTGSIVPQPVDIGIGAVFSTGYAISIAGIIYGEDYFSDNTNTKPEDIDQFLTAAEDLKEKPEPEIVDEPGQLIQAGDSLLTGLQTSNLEGTGDLASDLQDWLETFKQRELQGQKKMVGDLPNSDAQFSVWEDRYNAFQDLEEELREMDNSASRRVVLSVMGK
ncbi:hypothetical protein [Halobellus sp. EA9]|uniref:hypothetical protein n=1 Tax=Halobellus sp. EA9 TaxID=3421647 RepID=UPI003EBA1C3E